MEFSCCFLNCKNLRAASPASHRPELQPAVVNAKLSNLAATLREAAGGRAPDLIGLCEVDSEAVGRLLGETLSPGRYDCVWAGEPPRGYTGLMILYFQLRESTLRIVRPHGNCSDHSAVGAAFEIKEPGNG